MRKRRKRTKGKDTFDASRRIQAAQILKGDVVLKHDAKGEIDMSRKKKLSYWWLGPYHVREAVPEKGMYKLEEFDGTRVPGTHARNRLKKFVRRDGFYKPIEGKDDIEPKEQAEEEKENRPAIKDFEIWLPTLTAA